MEFSLPRAASINPLATEEFENNKKALMEENMDILGEKTDIKNQAPVEDNAPVIPEPVKEEAATPPAEAEGEFYLITGSFKSEANAITQANRLIKEGFASEIHDAPNGFYRVCAMRCKDMSMAVIKKDSISKKFPGTWIKKI